MSKASRDKGASGEREVVARLRDELGLEHVARQLDQARDGGCDIVISVAGKSCAIEVKRTEACRPLAYMRQVQAVDADLHLVLWRKSREDWLAMVPWDTLMTLLREQGVSDAPEQPKQPSGDVARLERVVERLERAAERVEAASDREAVTM